MSEWTEERLDALSKELFARTNHSGHTVAHITACVRACAGIPTAAVGAAIRLAKACMARADAASIDAMTSAGNDVRHALAAFRAIQEAADVAP